MAKWQRAFVMLLLALGVGAARLDADQIGKWRRHTISLSNQTYGGNPFEIEVDATFTHTASGENLTLPGYYAGNDTWKIGFMPTQVGEWTWVTSSSDSDLDGQTGSVDSVASGNRGLLAADPDQPRKWKFADGPYVVPLAFRFDVFQENGSLSRFTEIADFVKDDVQGHMLEFTLRNEVFSDWSAHQFDLPLWDRLEQRMEVLAERGLGIHFMFYSDDAQRPAWSGRSATEALLIRYTAARLAGFPVVIVNTGIDIAEYRSHDDINWLGQQFQSVDPYGHPISSRLWRRSSELIMATQTFESRGDLRAYIDDITGYFENASVPISMDDAWSENSPEAEKRGKNFTEHDIRRAIWKCVLAGGAGAVIRGSVLYNEDLWFRMANFETDLESEQFLVLINPFINNELGNLFGDMVPTGSLVANGYALADPSRTKILYLAIGANDEYDPGGGDLTIKLTGLGGVYDGKWFDPRTGQQSQAGPFAGGSNYTVTPPSNDDWVLLLSDPGTQESYLLSVSPGGTGSGSITSNPAGIDCGADCDQIYTDGTVVELTPAPDAGSVFADWTGDPDCQDGTVSMTSDRSCTAVFDAVAPSEFELSVTIGGTGSGTVTSQPAGIDCGADCQERYGDGTVVLLSAAPDSGSVFAGWTGDSDCSDDSVTMNDDRSCTAVFNQIAEGCDGSVRIDGWSTAPGSSYDLAAANLGELVFTDRGYTISSISSNLRSQAVIQTANADKNVDQDQHLFLTLCVPARVHVAYDKRAATLPLWLSDPAWQASGESLSSTEGKSSPMLLFSRAYPAGAVVLGSNHHGGPTGAGTHYVVVVDTRIFSDNFESGDILGWN